MNIAATKSSLRGNTPLILAQLNTLKRLGEITESQIQNFVGGLQKLLQEKDEAEAEIIKKALCDELDGWEWQISQEFKEETKSIKKLLVGA